MLVVRVSFKTAYRAYSSLTLLTRANKRLMPPRESDSFAMTEMSLLTDALAGTRLMALQDDLYCKKFVDALVYHLLMGLKPIDYFLVSSLVFGTSSPPMAAPAFVPLPETLRKGLASKKTDAIKDAFDAVFNLTKLQTGSTTISILDGLKGGKNTSKTPYLKNNWDPTEIAESLRISLEDEATKKGLSTYNKLLLIQKLLWGSKNLGEKLPKNSIPYKSGVLSGGVVAAEPPATPPAARPATPPATKPAAAAVKPAAAAKQASPRSVTPPEPEPVNQSDDDGGGSEYDSVRGSPPRSPPDSPKSAPASAVKIEPSSKPETHPELTRGTLFQTRLTLDKNMLQPFPARKDPAKGYFDNLKVWQKQEESSTRRKRLLEEPNGIQELAETLAEIKANGPQGLRTKFDLDPVLLARRVFYYQRTFLDVEQLGAAQRWSYLDDLYEILWGLMPITLYVAPTPHKMRTSTLDELITEIKKVTKAFIDEHDRVAKEASDIVEARIKEQKAEAARIEAAKVEREAEEEKARQGTKAAAAKAEAARIETARLKEEQEANEASAKAEAAALEEAARLEKESEAKAEETKRREQEERVKRAVVQHVNSERERLVRERQKARLDAAAVAYSQHIASLHTLLGRNDLGSSDATMVTNLLEQTRKGFEALSLELLASIQPVQAPAVQAPKPRLLHLELLSLVYASQH